MGLAYLPDGTAIDYKEYITSHPHWQAVRQARLKFDNYQCVVCKKDVRELDHYEIHHLSYTNLGNEHMRDVVTMCSACHTKFHNNWARQRFWKGKESKHWEAFNIEHTAILCAEYFDEDKFICNRDDAPNLCNENVARQYIDQYFKDFQLDFHPCIDPHDFSLFVRNKRYELFFEAEKRGLTVEQFLDERYGPKVRGKNPLRQEAGKKNGPFDHTPESFHKHYTENPNLNKLMKEANKYIQGGEKC